MLRENEKLAATGRIAARIAHEINNPLAGIRNSFLLIKDGISPDHPYFSYVNRIENEIDRIARIVRQMFDLHRPDYVMPQEVDLHQTIGDVVALLDSIARARGVTLTVDSAGVARPSQLVGRLRCGRCCTTSSSMRSKRRPPTAKCGSRRR